MSFLGCRGQAYSEQMRLAGTNIALVLADEAVGTLIQESLRSCGFQSRLKAAPSPAIAASGLREVVGEFVRENAGQGSLWIHPGVTPVAERSEWPAISQEFGVQFIGPTSRSLSLFSNRLNLLGEAEKLQISNLLISPDPFHSVREIEKLIRSNKFKLPLVLKSVRGGSGGGVRVIHHLEDLGKSLNVWLEQIRRNLGEVIILAERYVEGARRIVQPFARLSDGSIELFPAVDASLTSRLRKLVEFCPALEDSNELKLVRGWTRSLSARAGYVGVGSLEFLVDGPRGYLIEGVARLNTGFHLWEKVAGTSAVQWQIAAMSGPADSRAPAFNPSPEWNSGMAVRIYAEDPVLQLPQPGMIRELSEKREWSFPGSLARFSVSVKPGAEVKPTDSPVLGHLWIGAEDRARAITVARGLLDEIWVAGSLQTNERFVQELVSHPWVQEGIFHASFVDEEFIPSVRPDAELLQISAQMARLLMDDDQSKWAVGDQWIKASPKAKLDWAVGPDYFSVGERQGVSGVVRTTQGRSMRALCYPVSENRWQTRVGNWFLPARRVPAKASHPGPALHKITALVAGRVHSIFFREGAWIPAHETVILVESLGSLVSHALPVDVRLVRWLVSAEDSVHAGQILAEFEKAPQAG